MQGRSFSSPVVGKFCPHAVEKFCLPYSLPIIPIWWRFGHAGEGLCLPCSGEVLPSRRGEVFPPTHKTLFDLEMTFLGFQWSMTSHVGYVVDNSVVVVVCGVFVLFLAFCVCGGRWSEGLVVGWYGIAVL